MTIQDQLPITEPKSGQAAKPAATTAQVLDALMGHYRKPGEDRDGEILITEPQAPGSVRRCDLLRVGMWASRGLGIDVHEIKVSRPDWLRELDDPAKAEAWWPYCSRFWVTTPPGIVAPAELPEGWGLMELPSRGRRFRVKVAAASKTPEVTIALLTELLRRADNARLAQIGALRREHDSEIYRVRSERAARQAEAQIPVEVKGRLDLLGKLEEALGMPLDAYGGWPLIPPTRITPGEAATLLTDTREHVTAQRRGEQAKRIRDQIEATAMRLLEQARRIGNEEAQQ